MVNLILIALSSISGHAHFRVGEVCEPELIVSTAQARPGFYEECLAVARVKMEAMLRVDGGQLVTETLTATEIDHRAPGAAGSISFAALAMMGDGLIRRLDVVTRKSEGGVCR